MEFQEVPQENLLVSHFEVAYFDGHNGLKYADLVSNRPESLQELMKAADSLGMRGLDFRSLKVRFESGRHYPEQPVKEILFMNRNANFDQIDTVVLPPGCDLCGVSFYKTRDQKEKARIRLIHEKLTEEMKKVFKDEDASCYVRLRSGPGPLFELWADPTGLFTFSNDPLRVMSEKGDLSDVQKCLTAFRARLQAQKAWDELLKAVPGIETWTGSHPIHVEEALAVIASPYLDGKREMYMFIQNETGEWEFAKTIKEQNHDLGAAFKNAVTKFYWRNE